MLSSYTPAKISTYLSRYWSISFRAVMFAVSTFFHGAPTPQCWHRASYTGKMNCLIPVTGTLKHRPQICFYCKFRSVVWAHAPQLVSLVPAYGTVDLFRRGCPATTAKLWLKNKTSTNQCANPSSRACVRVHARGGEGGLQPVRRQRLELEEREVVFACSEAGGRGGPEPMCAVTTERVQAVN